jgi:hypothetical protein
VPGMDDEVPAPAQVFRMATSGGAATTPFADSIGALEGSRASSAVPEVRIHLPPAPSHVRT